MLINSLDQTSIFLQIWHICDDMGTIPLYVFLTVHSLPSFLGRCLGTKKKCGYGRVWAQNWQL
jgi:hypothetical protein